MGNDVNHRVRGNGDLDDVVLFRDLPFEWVNYSTEVTLYCKTKITHFFLGVTS